MLLSSWCRRRCCPGTCSGIAVVVTRCGTQSASSRPHVAAQCVVVRHCATRSTTTAATTSDAVARVPRLLFFGGDNVSVVVLAALHQRLLHIVRHRLLQQQQQQQQQRSNGGSVVTTRSTATRAQDELTQQAAQLVRDRLYVVCPSLPPHVPMAEVRQRYRRHFPVARYCVAEQLCVFAVDDARSLSRSALLRDMLADGSAKCTRAADATSTAATTAATSTSSASYATSSSSLSSSSWAAAKLPLSAFDVAVVVSFRYFLPQRLLRALPPTINVHPSLLPRYRGASPIFATLQHNDDVGGVSIVKLAATQTMMDAGDVVWRRAVAIPRSMDIRQYFPRVTRVAARGLCEVVFGSDAATAAAAAGEEQQQQQQCACVYTTPTTRDDNGEHDDDDDDHVSSTYCDWPDSFMRCWRNAQPQPPVLVPRVRGGDNSSSSSSNAEAPVDMVPIRHYSEDPYHAPLLPKDAAVLQFDRHTALQVYGVWRAFVGGVYFHPALHATLHRECTPVRVQLLQRVCARRQRQRQRQQQQQQQHDKVNDDDDDVHGALAELQEGCAFTKAVHPCDVSEAVARELATVDAAHDVADGAVLTAGAGYFPCADETLAAVRCVDGWFYWCEAHLKRAARAQPAALLRKGLAMRTGVVYPGLFSPYRHE